MHLEQIRPARVLAYVAQHGPLTFVKVGAEWQGPIPFTCVLTLLWHGLVLGHGRGRSAHFVLSGPGEACFQHRLTDEEVILACSETDLGAMVRTP